LVIENRQNHDDRLIAAESPAAARTTIHRTRVSGGVTSMQKIDHLDIPAHSVSTFEPGELHLMLTETTSDLASQKSIQIRLHFENRGWIEVEAVVQRFGKPKKPD
jgi:copper(I)-binding protein